MSNVAHKNVNDTACRVCGATGGRIFSVREMNFGTREEFPYLKCGACGCLQILEYPADIRRHYPPAYYSFNASKDIKKQSFGAFALGKRRLKQAVLDWFPFARRRYLALASTQRWLASQPRLAIYVSRLESPSARILDVGCGDGKLLKELFDLYYWNVFGIDPFIESDIYYYNRLLVRCVNLRELAGQFDCISFHHALEHMPQQLRTLVDARRLLAPRGFLLIRIPIVDGYAWRTYRENWAQLDAPRHFYLHSKKSIEILAKYAGLQIESVFCDSTGFQFWASELYGRDISLNDLRSPAVPGGTPIFSDEKLAEYESRARELNARDDGDQVVIVLRHSETIQLDQEIVNPKDA